MLVLFETDADSQRLYRGVCPEGSAANIAIAFLLN